MSWRYAGVTETLCSECCWYENGSCTIPDAIYEYECPNFNDPVPVYAPDEIEYFGGFL